MKIVHICLGCFYIDNYSYQENMLPKFHKQMGLDVEIIASTLSFDKNGNACNIEPRVYLNEYGIKVTRLAYKRYIPSRIAKFLRIYEGFSAALENAKPNIIFVHGCQFCDIRIIVEYAKTHNITIYVDNHADFSNSATNWLSKNILHKGLWRYCAHLIEPYTKMFYGVLPVRVDFLKNIYKLPKDKCQLLVMGADDELVEKAKENGARETVRFRYGINSGDFLIITGGKIDRWKTQTLLLMEAVHKIHRSDVKLLVFGSVTEDLKSKIEKLADGHVVQFIGWVKSCDSYELFEAADLVVFPGRHSVMWEQVVGQGIPIVVKDWPGTHHVDLGGNVCYLENDSVSGIQDTLNRIISQPDVYNDMKKAAQEKGLKEFSYKEISKRSIDLEMRELL